MSPPLRVILWRTSYLSGRGGAEKVVHDLARELDRLGHRVSIFAEAPGARRGAGLPPPTDAVEVLALPIGNPLFTKGWRRPLALLRYLGGLYAAAVAIRRRRADVVHLHVLTLDVLALVLLRPVLGFRLIVTLAGGELELAQRHPLSAFKMTIAMRFADVVTCVAEPLQREVQRRWPYAAAVHITNPVDPRLSTGAVLGRALPPGGDLLFCGRLQPVKGADLLVEAYGRAVRRGVRRRLRIIGYGPDRTAIEKRVAAHGLSGRVVFLGALEHDRVLEEMSRAAIVVLASRSEACPIVVLEALALGRPVIAPRVGGIPDLIDDGRSGRLYRAGSVDELVEALLELDDDEVASGLAAVPETLMERHGIGPVAAAYLSVYRAMAGGPPAELRTSARRVLPRRRWGSLAAALRGVPCVLSRLTSALPLQRAKLPSGAMRVVLQAYSPHLAQFFVPVVDHLRQLAPDVEIWFAILPHPHFPARARRELRELAKERMSIADERIQSWRSLAGAPADVVLYGDVFAELPRGSARSCLLLHGPGVGSRMLRPRWFRKTIFDFDVVLANGSFDQRRLEHAIRQAGTETRVENVGLPILDGLLEPVVDRRSYLEGLGLDPERPTILFGPAWSGLAALGDRGLGYVRDTVEELSRLPANLLIKLHACSLNPTMAGGVSWIPWLLSARSEGIGVDLDPGDLPALAHCDVLVTDRSSRALNVQALGKPVVMWDPLPLTDAPWDRERTQLIRRGSLVAASSIEASELCSLAIADPSIGRSGIEASTEALSHFGQASVHAAHAVIRAATEAGGESSAVAVGDRRRLRRRRGSSV